MSYSTSQRILPPYIALIQNPCGPKKYKCDVCAFGERGMRDYEKHVSSQSHRDTVARLIFQKDMDNQIIPASESPRQRSPSLSVHKSYHGGASPQQLKQPDDPPSPLSVLQFFEDSDQLNPGQDPSPSDESDSDLDFHKLRAAFEALADEFGDEDQDQSDDEEAIELDLAGVRIQDQISWYPFKKKEHVVALLIIGSSRSLLSRNQYQRIRAILRICDVNLPDWGVLRAVSTRMKRKLGLELSHWTSPTGKPLFSIDIKTIIANEMANPLVSPHMVYLPELPLDEPINRFSQSEQWRQGYLPDLRVQMITSNDTHFFIYEPVQLRCEQLVVPVFFFQQNNRILAKCLPAMLQSDPENPSKIIVIIPEEPDFDSDELSTVDCFDFWKTFGQIEVEDSVFLKDITGDQMYVSNPFLQRAHPIVNKWRARAGGKVIQHVPITDAVGTKVYHTCIKNACKHAREKLHNVLLTGFFEPKHGEVVDSPIPDIRALNHRIALRCGTIGLYGDVESFWTATNALACFRVAYLRREAARIYQKGRGSSNILACVDAQLH